MNKPRIDKVTAEYYRKGKCAKCEKGNVERAKTFVGPTLDDCKRQAAEWEKTPLMHKRCEP